LIDIDKLINEFIHKNNSEILNIRREIHKYPEIGFEEFKTSEMIKTYLMESGLSPQNIAGTGVIVDINTNIKDYCIALRFDIDALPIFEDTGLEFSSAHDGKMHACGHDGHIAIGLGLAKMLNEIKDNIPARIRLIFQPAEEGLGGASKIIKEGALEDPNPNLIIGLHIWPYLESGKIGIKTGPVMAAGDKYYVRLVGKQGHGSSPHLAIDPTIMAAEIIQGFQKISSRFVNPIDPVVISVGTINGGESFNTIPASVEITGTTRFVDIELRKEIESRMEDIINGVVIASRGSYEFVYEKCFDVTTSDEELVNILESTAYEIIGQDNVIRVANPNMASEDFSEYEKLIPGLYFFVGTRNEDKDCVYPLHNSKYKLDEDIISNAITLLGKLVINISNMKLKEGLDK